MTPLAMEMLIWFHVHPAHVMFPNIEREPQQEIANGFIEECAAWRVGPYQYSLTPLGEAWLRLTLASPLGRAEDVASAIAAEVFEFDAVRERLTEAEAEAFHGFVQERVMVSLGAASRNPSRQDTEI